MLHRRHHRHGPRHGRLQGEHLAPRRGAGQAYEALHRPHQVRRARHPRPRHDDLPHLHVLLPVHQHRRAHRPDLHGVL